jgi:hypothetical protein
MDDQRIGGGGVDAVREYTLKGMVKNSPQSKKNRFCHCDSNNSEKN